MLTRADCTTRNQRKADRLRRTYDDLEARIARLSEEEELASIRPDLDGNQIMEILGIGPGREVGEAYRFLLELRLDEGPMTRGRTPGPPCSPGGPRGSPSGHPHWGRRPAASASSVPRMAASRVQQVVVMGVSGVGKTTVAKGMSTPLGWEFAEGDAFHPEANVAKMGSGTALTDEDRGRGRAAIGDWISAEEAPGGSAVVTCSALRRVYRDLLREGRPEVVFCHLVAGEDLIGERMVRRTDHYMPASLLPSQLATLEPLGPDEPGVAVTNEGSAAQVLDRALAALGHRKEHA